MKALEILVGVALCLGGALLIEMAWDELRARLSIFSIIDRKAKD